LGLYAGFFVWLFSGSNRANRFFVGILKRVPGAGRIYRDLDMARLAATWSILMARDVPSNDALAVTAELMEDGKTANALRGVSAEAAKGEPLAFLLEKERSVSPMFPLTIRHVPEKALPEELGNLAELFRERASIATRKAGMTWEILLLLFLWFFVGSVVLSMFLPLISIVKKLGGG
jgi:type IV pilus assembly protein PilC